MPSQSDNGLFTPEMEQAERELDARIDYALSVGREVQERVDELEQKMADQEPPSDEDVERFKTYILGHARTDEWQQVIDLIDQGELTWRQVVDGLAAGNLDRRVAAAFESLSKVPPASMEKLIEIGVFPAELPDKEPDGDEAEASDGSADRDSSAAQEEEQWFYEDPLKRRTSW